MAFYLSLRCALLRSATLRPASPGIFAICSNCNCSLEMAEGGIIVAAGSSAAPLANRIFASNKRLPIQDPSLSFAETKFQTSAEEHSVR